MFFLETVLYFYTTYKTIIEFNVLFINFLYLINFLTILMPAYLRHSYLGRRHFSSWLTPLLAFGMHKRQQTRLSI